MQFDDSWVDQIIKSWVSTKSYREKFRQVKYCSHVWLYKWLYYRENPGVRNGNQLQYSFLQNHMDRGAWQVISPWGYKELDMTEQTHIHTQKHHTHGYIGICMCVYVYFIFYKILDFTFVYWWKNRRNCQTKDYFFPTNDVGFFNPSLSQRGKNGIPSGVWSYVVFFILSNILN